MAEELLLRMEQIDKDFNGVQVLKDVNFDVKLGEIHALCGENGAGKSTLMKILSGVYPKGDYSGEIIFDNEGVSFQSIEDSENAGISIIHQELALIPELSVAENIFLGADKPKKLGLIDWNAVNQAAETAIARVGLKENVMEAVGRLGVGKQQLVEIAKALRKNARLLILDEPTAALNDEDSRQLLNLIRSLRDNGTTIVIISHKLGEIREIADRVTILRDGSTIDTLDMSDSASTTDKIISLMVGRPLENLFPDRQPTIGEEVLRVENWTVEHPTRTGHIVLKDVSFNVRRGEVVGIAGLMGAGRTELATSVFGRAWGKYQLGTIYIEGKPVKLTSPEDAIRYGLAYASEDRKTYGLNLIGDIKSNISTVGLRKLIKRGFIDIHKEVDVAEKYRASMRIRCDNVGQRAGSLSGGNQQKVVLSRWLFSDPEVLILDEPTRGIDVGAKYEIYTLINEMVAQGKAVIIISSELEEILGMTDRIFVMAYGHMTGEVAREDATQEGLMELMTKEPEMEESK